MPNLSVLFILIDLYLPYRSPSVGQDSWGEGVRREVIQACVQRTFSQDAGLFQPRFGEKLVFAPSSDIGVATEGQLERCRRAGSVVALSMLFLGQIPAEFSPLFVLWCINGGDSRCFTRSVVMEHAQPLVAMIDNFREAGENGDISFARGFFASYLEQDVSEFNIHRSRITHI